MQWDTEAFSGFSSAKSWIPLNSDYDYLNVALQEKDKASLLSKYKQLITLRNTEPILQYGSYEKLELKDECIHFIRKYQESRINVLINFGKPYNFKLPNEAKILLGNIHLQTNDFLIFKE